jgi:hypothetical protein
MRYAVWYDNSSGFFEAFKVIEASTPEEAIASSREQGLGGSSDVVVTEATEDQNGFSNDPNRDTKAVLGTSRAD